MTGKPDPRVRELFNHVREATKILEDLIYSGAAAEPRPKVEAKSPEGERHAPAILDKLAYSIKEVTVLANVSRTILYRDISEGRLRAVKRGNRTLILVTDLQDWIATWTESR